LRTRRFLKIGGSGAQSAIAMAHSFRPLRSALLEIVAQRPGALDFRFLFAYLRERTGHDDPSDASTSGRRLP
jgi:hypothetical protein